MLLRDSWIYLCVLIIVFEKLSLGRFWGLNYFNLQQRKFLLPSSRYLNLPAQHCLIHAQRLRLSWITLVIQRWAASWWEDWFISTSLFSWEQSSMGFQLKAEVFIESLSGMSPGFVFWPLCLARVPELLLSFVAIPPER